MNRLGQIMGRITRARSELELACQELQIVDDDLVAQGKIGGDIGEVRARVDALEARVAAIEDRGEH